MSIIEANLSEIPKASVLPFNKGPYFMWHADIWSWLLGELIEVKNLSQKTKPVTKKGRCPRE